MRLGNRELSLEDSREILHELLNPDEEFDKAKTEFLKSILRDDNILKKKEKATMSENPIIIEIPTVETWTMKDLKYTCRHNKVKGYTKMSKEELIDAVKKVIQEN